MSNYEFVQDDRLGIKLPVLRKEWEKYSEDERSQILYHWEQIRGTIPERIKQLERMIVQKQLELNEELNFVRSCSLNSDIAELASTINDLHLWFRVNQQIHSNHKHE